MNFIYSSSWLPYFRKLWQVKDGVYQWVIAVILGEMIVLDVSKVTAPLTVRYGWAHNPGKANLVIREGLPASPFEKVVQGNDKNN
ncbi:hypothetical protein [Lunatibacter salilacus]|uniref:hypothetical protein n=1 Tax=Lunatibacter salilacus TaxID=2483804 RepID=UPI00131E81E8|nr:hypothetical protein [Lunatibacter salilacus]